MGFFKKCRFVPSCWWSCDAFLLVRQHWWLWCLCVDRVYIPQHSGCHETLGATDMFAAFPVVLRRTEFWLTSQMLPVQFSSNWGWNPLSCISALPCIAEIYSEIVLISGIVWCFERSHMVKDNHRFFVPRLSLTNSDGVFCVCVCFSP